jgi:hypothetical protein
MKVAGIGRRVVLAALIGGVAAMWAAGLAGAASGDCSQAGRTVTCTFTYVGHEQTFTVPAGIGSVQIDAVGAPGGGAVPGGSGGTVSASVGVTPGQTLFVEVGGGGSTSGGGWNGGGDPGSGGSVGGGGGGASDVRAVSCGASCATGGNAASLGSRLVVAGGGGGNGAAGAGGGSLGLGGAAGSDGADGHPDTVGDGGGVHGSAGSGGPGLGGSGGTTVSGTDGTGGANGAAGAGGVAGGGPGANTTGGGGGGGYFGGGGGGGGATNGLKEGGGGGGGGGSCFANNAPTACGAAPSSTPSVTITYTLPDTTAPTISIVSPAANAAYPLGTAVPASFSCAEEAGGSGLASCQGLVAAGSPIDTSTPGVHSFTVTARDNAGNTSTQTVSYTVLGAPTATISAPAAGGRYVLGQVVRTAFTCSEAPGGPGIVACGDSRGTQVAAGLSPSKGATGALDTSHPGTHTYTVSAASADGLSGSTAITYTVVGPPAIEIKAPIANHTYDVGQAVPVKYTCTDGSGGPGITSCSGSIKKGRLLYTQSPGTFKFTVTAKSRDGQKTRRTVSYTTAVPANHPVIKLGVGNVVLTDASVSMGHPDPTAKQFSACGGMRTPGPACSKQQGTLVIEAAFPARAPFKKSQHRELFSGAGQSGSLTVYVRGPGNTTVTLTWSLGGVLISGYTVGQAQHGVVVETLNLNYQSIQFKSCKPDSACSVTT